MSNGIKKVEFGMADVMDAAPELIQWHPLRFTGELQQDMKMRARMFAKGTVVRVEWTITRGWGLEARAEPVWHWAFDADVTPEGVLTVIAWHHFDADVDRARPETMGLAQHWIHRALCYPENVKLANQLPAATAAQTQRPEGAGGE